MYFESETASKQSALKRIYLLGGISFCLLIFLSIKSVIPSIEKDILKNISKTYFEKKITNVIVSVKGQEVTLEGLVTKTIQSQAIESAQQVPGVTNVNSEFIIIDEQTKQSEPK